MKYISSIMIFLLKTYCKRINTEFYLKSKDIINKNNNSTYNLFNNSNNLNNNYDIKEYNLKNIYNGFDLRKNISVFDNEEISIYNMNVFLYKKKLLELLMNQDINIHDKLTYIDDYKKIFDSINNNKDLMKNW